MRHARWGGHAFQPRQTAHSRDSAAQIAVESRAAHG